MSKQTKTHVYSEHISTRWGDMDAYGHVNNIIYFQYFEQARTSWLYSIGGGEYLTTAAKISPVLLKTEAQYILPVVHPMALKVLVYASEPGNSSLLTSYELRSDCPQNQLLATGEGLLVWFDKIANQSTPIPEKLRREISSKLV